MDSAAQPPRADQPKPPTTPTPTQTEPTHTGTPGTARPGSYKIAPGDTFSKIAKTQLGDASRWREIQALNPNVDVRMLRVGMEIKLPQ